MFTFKSAAASGTAANYCLRIGLNTANLHDILQNNVAFWQYAAVHNLMWRKASYSGPFSLYQLQKKKKTSSLDILHNNISQVWTAVWQMSLKWPKSE